MLFRRFNKLCLRLTAPNSTKAEQPFYEFAYGSARNANITASAVSFSVILSCEIPDFGQQLSV